MSQQNQTPHSHVSYTDDGHCYYSDNNLTCCDVVYSMKSIVESALGRIDLQGKDKPFVICDYGAADGGTSRDLFNDVIKWIKEKYGARQQIHVIYEDQAVNDFKSIFLQFHGMLPGRPSYLQGDGVFVTACGTSFYSQCLPDNSVHLAFSATAFHWLSRRPCQLSGTAVHMRATDPDEIEKFENQASEDWTTILLHRAKELVPGGQMAITVLCRNKVRHMVDDKVPPKPNAPDRLDRLWKKMWDLSKITEEEFNAATFNCYLRTEDELAAPFLDVDSPVSKVGLRLLYIGGHRTDCVHKKNWDKQLQKDQTAAREYAVRRVSAFRLWSNYTYLSALSSERTDKVKQELVDELYQMHEDELAAAPGDHGDDYWQAHIHFEKLLKDDH